jgi:hypothetical protein
MKKLFLIVAVTMFSTTLELTKLNAQTVTYDMTSSIGVAKDTITNTGTNSVTIPLAKSYDYIAIQPVITKITGTIVNSKAQLMGSVDNVNWQIISAADTLHISNVTTNTCVWVKLKADVCPYAYLGVFYTGAGTMTASLKAKVCLKIISTH